MISGERASLRGGRGVLRCGRGWELPAHSRGGCQRPRRCPCVASLRRGTRCAPHQRPLGGSSDGSPRRPVSCCFIHPVPHAPGPLEPPAAPWTLEPPAAPFPPVCCPPSPPRPGGHLVAAWPQGADPSRWPLGLAPRHTEDVPSLLAGALGLLPPCTRTVLSGRLFPGPSTPPSVTRPALAHRHHPGILVSTEAPPNVPGGHVPCDALSTVLTWGGGVE